MKSAACGIIESDTQAGSIVLSKRPSAVLVVGTLLYPIKGRKEARH